MQLNELLDRFDAPWLRWSFAAAAVSIATVFNVGYQVLDGGFSPFMPYFPFLCGIAVLAGRTPAFASVLAIAVIVPTVWMEPNGLPWAMKATHQWAVVGFLAAGYVTVWVALAMRDYARQLASQSRVVERQRAELQTMLDLIPVGVGISRDANADQITVSPNFAAMLGLGQGQNASLSGPARERVPFRAMRDGRELDAAELPMQVASRTGTEVKDFDLDIVRADGRTIELRVSAAPLFDEYGRVRGAIGAHVDVTSLRQASRDLAESSRQKDEFLATLAHELRNPLAPVRYAAALLRRDQSPDAIEKARGSIERQAVHMSRLLDDLLDLSRISRNAIELQRETLDLVRVTRESLDVMRSEFEAKGQQVEWSFPAEAIWIAGDRERLHQVIVNLLSNASKYSAPGGHIVVAVLLEPAVASVQVRDDGIGLSADAIPRIFELFTRVHDQHAEPGSGLGIGLAVVHRLVKLHGGKVQVASEGPGKGAAFTVSLPRVSAPVEQAAYDRDPVEPFDAGQGPQVLIVDDSQDAADVLAEYLRMHGLSVHVAYGGAQATAIVERIRPDVVVLDIGMPRMDGHAVARWIRARPWGASIRLIALTGWGQPADRARTQSAGFDLHLVKPVDPDLLLDQLAAMRSPRAAAQHAAADRVPATAAS